jgi:hypothetical protein
VIETARKLVRRLYVSLGDGVNVIRRSITVDDDINSTINKFRGLLLSSYGQEVDFTTMINAMARVGINRLFGGSATPEEWSLVHRFLYSYPELKDEGLTDAWVDRFIKKQLPKLLEEWSKSPSSP